MLLMLLQMLVLLLLLLLWRLHATGWEPHSAGEARRRRWLPWTRLASPVRHRLLLKEVRLDVRRQGVKRGHPGAGPWGREPRVRCL